LPTDPIEAARCGLPVADPKLAALQRFTKVVVKHRGHLDLLDLAAFEEAGYGPAQVLEVVLGICVKFFSNLTNNIVGIPLDDEFEPFAWQKALAKSSTR
jgi:alkylhydroperoxidase family enzyme